MGFPVRPREPASATMTAVLFDLDGTLVDLPVDISAVRRRAARIFEERGWRGELRPILPAIDVAAAEVAGGAGDRRRLVAAARAIIDEAEIEAAERAAPRLGAAATIRALAERRVPVGVVSNNCHTAVHRAMAGLGVDDLVGAMIGRDDVAAPKPEPAGLAAAVARLGDPSRIVWVGDSPGDVEAGRRLASSRPDLEVVVAGLAAVPGADVDLQALEQLFDLLAP